MDINIGDIVTIDRSITNVVDWINDFEELTILDIYDKGNNWIVAVLDQPYLDSEGRERNEILLSNLKKDIVSTRNKIIDDLTDET